MRGPARGLRPQKLFWMGKRLRKGGLAGLSAGLLLGLLAVAWAGCVSQGTHPVFPDESTPTVTPGEGETGTPVEGTTPPKQPADFAMLLTELLIGSSSQGLDLDGDGTLDNSIAETLDAIYQWLYSLIVQCPQQPCEVGPTAQTFLDIMAQILTVDALNLALASGGTYYLRFQEYPDFSGMDCAWYAESLATEAQIARQPGALDANGTGWYGFADVPLQLKFAVQVNADQEVILLPFTLRRALTKAMNVLTPQISMIEGGGLWIEDVLDWVEAMLYLANGYLPDAVDIDVVNVSNELRQFLLPYADLDLFPVNLPDGVPDSFSVGLALDGVFVD